MPRMICIGFLAACSMALGQESKPAQPEPRSTQPTLDELLGTAKDKKDQPPAKPVEDPTRTELERQLTMKAAEEQFKQAVTLMEETATRIKDGKDTGLATQRMQEDIIRKLDMVITSAEQQQQRQQRQRQQQRQQQQNQDPGQQSQQQTQNQDERGNNPAEDVIDPPAQQDANLRPGTAARGAMWGNLPERIRNALSQGDADKYSSMYRKWTEAYYRKLAEEANK